MTHEQPPESPDGNPQEAEPQLPDAEQHKDLETTQPRIWAGSLSDYNNGVLHGSWLDAARDPDEIQADIQTMLTASPWTARTGEPAEEWGIFDTDNFGDCRIDQHEDLDWVSGVARGIAEHGPAFAAWADVVEDPGLLDNFDEAYLGEYDNLEAYAEQLTDDLGYNQLLDDNLPEHIRRYVDINYAGLAQDMWLNGDVQVYDRSDGGVWIFHGQ